MSNRRSLGRSKYEPGSAPKKVPLWERTNLLPRRPRQRKVKHYRRALARARRAV